MEAQGYQVIRKTCSRCKHFLTKGEPAEWVVKLWPNDPEKWKSRRVHKGKRCGVGGFSVKDSGACNLWEALDDDDGE